MPDLARAVSRLAAGLCALAAPAMPLHAATYMAEVSIVSQQGSTDDVRSSANPLFLQLSQASGKTVAQATPLAGGTAYTLSDGGNGFAYAARAEIIYDIRLVGPSLASGQGVPVLVHAYGFATTTGGIASNTQAGASFNFSNVNFASINTNINGFANSALGNGSQIFTVSQIAQLVPNIDYRVTLIAFTRAGHAYGQGVGRAEALVDPIFTIQPGYGQYSLKGLLVAPSAVPEPAGWALMIAGFALMGSASRRRGRMVFAA